MCIPVLRRLTLALMGAASLLAAGSARAAPPWWRVSNGHGEVWILGAPRIVPRDMAWDASGLDRRLTQVSTVLVGPRPRVSIMSAGLVFSGLSALSAQPLEPGLPPALRQRFVAAREQMGKPAQRYANWKPIAVIKFLLDDFYQTNALQLGGVEAGVIKKAQSMGVRDAPVGTFDQTPVVDQAEALNPAGQLTCLDATLHDIERGAGVIRAVAAGWNRGETNDVPIDRIDRACVVLMPAIDAQAERTLVQESAAVAQALASSQRVIGVFELHNMTMQGGVVDRLRAMGLQVSGPMP